MGRMIPFLLGLFGGLIGILAAIFALGVGGLGSVVGAEGASEVIGLGTSAFAFSLLGIVGAAMVNYNPSLTLCSADFIREMSLTEVLNRGFCTPIHQVIA